MISRLVLAVVVLMQTETAPVSPTFKISGTVVREDGQPPAQVTNTNQIRLTGPPTSIIRIADDGTFQFPNIPAGNYRLVVGPNITMEEVPVVVSDKDVTGVRLFVPAVSVLVATRATINIEEGAIRPRIQVEFTKTGSAPGTLPANLQVGSGTSLLQLSAGEYRVAVTGLPAGFKVQSVIAGTTNLLSDQLRIATGEMPLVTVTLGVSSPVPWVKVTGQFTGQNRAQSISIPAAASVGGLGESLSVPINPDGSFEIPKILPGTYALNPLPRNNTTPNISLVVGNTDLTNVNIGLPPSRQVDGRITVEGDGPMPRTATLSFAMAAGNQNAVAPPPPRAPAPARAPGSVTVTAPTATSTTISIQPDGSFQVGVLEGERPLSLVPASIPKGYVVKSITYGGTDLLKTPIRVAMTDTSDMRITLDATQVAVFKVSGRVVNLGAALPAGTVTLASPSANQIITDTNGTLSVVSSGPATSFDAPLNSDGTFVFSKVLAGTYTARFSVASGAAGNANVVVADKDIMGVEIAMPKEITGRVVVEGSGPPPRVVLPLAPILTAGMTPATAVNSSLAVSPQFDGAFRTSLPTGERHVGLATGLPPGYFLKSVMYGTTNVIDETLKIMPADAAELVITLSISPETAQLYSLSGRIAGLPVAAARGSAVVLTGPPIGTGFEAPVMPDGSFAFDKLFPGSYSAQFRLNGIQAGTSFAITNKNVTDVVINYSSRTYNVAAHVVVESGPAGTASPSVVFSVRRPDGTPIAQRPIGNPMIELTLVPGDNTVSAGSIPSGYQLKSLMYGTVDLQKETLKMDGPVVSEIVATLVPVGR